MAIRYFSVLNPGGVVDGDRIGAQGIPSDERRYPNEYLAQAPFVHKRFALLAEELGYDILWGAEHHFQHEGYQCTPNILLLSLWLAQHTKRIKFGCAFNILPMWHPLRLAEDFSLVDILTGGRVLFGVGRGYHLREVETFGAPLLDAEANRELFEEQLEIVMKALSQESFSHRGKHYVFPPDNLEYRGHKVTDLTLVPRPLHPVETWQPIVSGNVRGIELMAKHGIKGMVLGTASLDKYLRLYQEANERQGRHLRLGENTMVALWAHMDETYEKAKKAYQPVFEEFMKFGAPLGILRHTEKHLQALDPTGRAQASLNNDFDEALKTRAWWCGTPKDLIDYLKELEEKYPGLEHIGLTYQTGMSSKDFENQVKIFATEVMPAFRSSIP